MIIEFKSKAAGAFFMTEPVMKMVFSAMQMEFSAKGIFTEEQVPQMRARLAAAIDRAKQLDQARLSQHDEAVREGEASGRDLPIGLSQRAFPLLEMLTAAEKKAREVRARSRCMRSASTEGKTPCGWPCNCASTPHSRRVMP